MATTYDVLFVIGMGVIDLHSINAEAFDRLFES